MKKLSNKQFIENEVKTYLTTNVLQFTGRYAALTVAENMPSFGSFIAVYYMEMINGAHYPVDIEELYINSDDYEELYNEVIIETIGKLIKK